MPKRIIKVIKHVKKKANQESVAKFVFTNKDKLIKLLLGIFVILIIYAIFSIYQNSQAKKYSAILHESLIAQQAGDIKTAKEKLLKIQQSSFVPANVGAVASIRYAGFLLDEGNKKEAGIVYHKISNCLTCNDYLKDLAGLLAISTWLADEEIMKTDLSSAVNKIYKNSHSLKFHIAEQRGFYEMQKNNFEVADKIFGEIIDNADADKSIKSRAQDARKILVQKGYKSKLLNDKTKEKPLEKSTEKSEEKPVEKSTEKPTESKDQDLKKAENDQEPAPAKSDKKNHHSSKKTHDKKADKKSANNR